MKNWWERGDESDTHQQSSFPKLTTENKVSKKKYIVISSVIGIIMLGALVYATRSLEISSCTTLAGNVENEAAISAEIQGTEEVPCPEPFSETEKIDAVKTTKVTTPPKINDPSTPPANEPSNQKNSGSSKDPKNTTLQPANQSNTSEMNVTNTPPTSQSGSSQQEEPTVSINTSETASEQTTFSHPLIDEFIATNNLDIGCAVYNQTISGVSSLVSLQGHRTVRVAGVTVKIPVDVRLVVSQDTIILECIKTPWWAYLLK